MLVPKKDRLAVYQFLFKEGVMVCKKDMTLNKHPHIPCPNLYVMKMMQSFASRGFVTEKYAWRWQYFTLTDEGIQYLRDYLHIPEEFVPDTLKKSVVKTPARPSFRQEESGDRRRTGGDRDGYRAGRGGRGGFRGGRGGSRGGRPE